MRDPPHKEWKGNCILRKIGNDGFHYRKGGNLNAGKTFGRTRYQVYQ